MRPLSDSVFEPDELKELRAVFDDTWTIIAREITGDVDAFRDELGALILGLACERQLGREQIKQTAARLMRERHGLAPTDVRQVLDAC
jgi:hypothetical protein